MSKRVQSIQPVSGSFMGKFLGEPIGKSVLDLVSEHVFD